MIGSNLKTVSPLYRIIFAIKILASDCMCVNCNYICYCKSDRRLNKEPLEIRPFFFYYNILSINRRKRKNKTNHTHKWSMVKIAVTSSIWMYSNSTNRTIVYWLYIQVLRSFSSTILYVYMYSILHVYAYKLLQIYIEINRIILIGYVGPLDSEWDEHSIVNGYNIAYYVQCS